MKKGLFDVLYFLFLAILWLATNDEVRGRVLVILVRIFGGATLE